jgi:hypothetical protein
MERSDKIFLIWGIIVIGFVVLVGTSETTSEYIKTFGVAMVMGELFALFGFLVIIPYVIHRWIVKRKF